MSDWSDLLRRLETKLFAIADEYELEALAATAPDRLATRSLCSPGAAPASIAAREAALGAALPADYRAFLLASNGFQGLAGLPHGLCSLLPVEEIGWLRDKDRQSGRLAAYLAARADGSLLVPYFMVDRRLREHLAHRGERRQRVCVVGAAQRLGRVELWTYDPEACFFTDDTFTGLMESALQV